MNNKTFDLFIRRFIGIHNPNCIVVMLDGRGIIQKTTHADFMNASRIVSGRLRPGEDIGRFFLLPEGKSIPEIADNPDRAIELMADRAGLFTFKDESEEYYSRIPLLFIRFYRFDGEIFAGVIHFAKYFHNMSNNLDRVTYFCVNDEERLAAFNRHFAVLFTPAGGRPEELLGRPLGDFITPTSTAVQHGELKGLETLRPPDFKPVLSRDFTAPDAGLEGVTVSGNAAVRDRALEWTAPESGVGWVLFDKPFDWATQDVRVEFTLEGGASGPPSLMLTDTPLSDGNISDRDGYLLGPDSSLDSVILKRGGDLFDQRFCGREALAPGRYAYCRTGNLFLIYRNGALLYGYCDHDFIPRRETRILLYLREKRECRISSLSLHVWNRSEPVKRRNVFVSSVSHPENYYLLSRIYRFRLKNRDGEEEGCTLFQLRNLSDLRENIQGLEEALERKSLMSRETERRLKAYVSAESAFLGNNRVITQIREKAERIADSSATLLIEGQTGTGKEVLARYIHAVSPFSEGPFIKVDCSTLPGTLMESLLFGHEKGAFTGANEARKGLFEQASGGTLFIDEAGNLTPEIQAKLLQFLQDRILTPLGGSRSVRVETRIIVASNIPLKSLVDQGRFREDLYYRIAVLDIRLPLLAEHIDDAPVLVAHMIKELNRKYGKKIKGLSPAAYQQIYGHGWPGNVRELKNVIEKAYLYSEGTEITGIVLPLAATGPAAGPGKGGAKARKAARYLDEGIDEVKKAVKMNHGNMKATAEKMGVTLRALYYFLEKHNVSPNDLREHPRRLR